METKETKNESRLTAAAHTFFEVAKTECTENNKNVAILITDSEEDGTMVMSINGRPLEIIPAICAAMNADERMKKVFMKAVETYALVDLMSKFGIDKDTFAKNEDDNEDGKNEEE